MMQQVPPHRTLRFFAIEIAKAFVGAKSQDCLQSVIFV
jgi:hypothetical protein